MPVILSNSPEETLRLGEQWGREAKPGWLIGLTGDLGAGKTQLVKGIARGLGIASRIQSPTFTLVHEYREGRLPLYHIDLYRLKDEEEALKAGVEDCLYSGNLSLVEWPEKALALFPPDTIHAFIEIVDDKTRLLKIAKI